ncbi:MAG: four helix bundle protein [Deltaproteobacteria bacterium]|nr:four helix bundle protein [Deltaproteobacteria bacterium]
MDLTIYFENIARDFSRYHKYTLGTELREESREILELIIKANSTRQRLPLLLELRDSLEGLKVVIRICKEVKAFHRFNSFVHASDLVQTERGMREESEKGLEGECAEFHHVRLPRL